MSSRCGELLSDEVQDVAYQLTEMNFGEDEFDESEERINLLDLPWDDILISRILLFLPMKQLFNLQRVSKHFQELIHQYMASCSVLDFSSIGSKVTKEAFLTAVERTESLRVLSLHNCKGWLKDEILMPVIARNKHLRSVDLGSSSGLTSQSVHCIAVNCCELTSITLSECHWVQAPSMAVLALNCRNLQHVDLTSCWELDDETVITLIMTNPGLKFLSLAKIYGITDVVIDMLARSCPKLECLNIQGCWRITNSVIRLLGDCCPKLRRLGVEDCRDVSEASLARLRVKGIEIDVKQPPRRLHEAQHPVLAPYPAVYHQI
ncbi:uncharacterized protein LOC144452525 [Glandiceps talaboti]